MLRAFLDADEAMRESPHPRVELEIAAVRATRRPAAAARSRSAQARGGGRGAAAPAGDPSACRRRARVQESLLDRSRPGRPRRPSLGASRRQPERPAPPAARVSPAPSRVAEASPCGPRPPLGPEPALPPPRRPPAEDVATGWQRVVEEVMRRKPTLGAVLASPPARGAGRRADARARRKPLPS